MSRRGHSPRLAIVLAACAGFGVAAATAFGYAKLNVWREYGENFQLGYIVGYLDGVNLAQHHDERAFLPTGGRPQYERWRAMVNEFYADPANAARPIPDAMGFVGAKMRAEMFQRLRARRGQLTPTPGRSPTEGAAAGGVLPLSPSPHASPAS